MPRDQLRLIFEDHMEQLKGLMRVPKSDPIYVAIVDDNERAVIGLRTVLGNWNNLGATTVIQAGGKMPKIDLRNDIVLLDEDMAGISGNQVAKWMIDHGFTGLIASIAFCDAESMPAYKRHFNDKVGVGTSVDATVKFIKFMNMLIDKIEYDRGE